MSVTGHAPGDFANEIQDVIEILGSGKRNLSLIKDEVRTLTQIIQRGEEPTMAKNTTPASAHKLMQLVESNQNQARLFEDRLLTLAQTAHQDQRLISELVDRLLEDIKSVLMLPFSTFLES